jgi:hypothetical protein
MLGSRIEVSALGDDAEICAKAERPAIPATLAGMWLAAWTLGGVRYARTIRDQAEWDYPTAFRNITWLLVWAVSVCATACFVLWIWLGRRVIRLTPRQLIVENRLLRFRLPGRRVFDASLITKMRLVEHEFHTKGHVGFSRHVMVFDYDGKQDEISWTWTEKDARRLLEGPLARFAGVNT